MVQFGGAMLSTQQQLAASAHESDRTYYENKAAGLDRQIDDLTYDLHGLTEEEKNLARGG